MPTATLYSQTDDGYIFGSATGSYATARSTAASSDDTATTATVGQRFIGGSVYRCYRGFVSFDTTTLPADAIVTGATLYICAATDGSTTDFLVRVYRYLWASSLAANLEADYDGAYGSGTLEGTLRDTSAGWTSGTYYSLAVDPAGIDLADYTNYALVSAEDVNNSAPTGDEYVDFYTADEAGTTKDPYLEVTYSLPGTASSTASSLLLMGCGG